MKKIGKGWVAAAIGLGAVLGGCGDDPPSRPSGETTVTRSLSAAKGGTLSLEGLTVRIPPQALAGDGEVTLAVRTAPPIAFDDLSPRGPVYSLKIDAEMNGAASLLFTSPGPWPGNEAHVLFDDGSRVGIGRLAAGDAALGVPYSTNDLATAPGEEVRIWLAEKRDFSAITEPVDPEILGIHHFGKRVHPGQELVVLIHGLASSHASAWEAAGDDGGPPFRGFVEGLMGQDAVVWSYQYDTAAPIETSAGALERSLLGLLGEARPPVTLIGHSMGGILARHLAKHAEGTVPIKQVILLGAPNNGAASESTGVLPAHRGAFVAFISIDRSLAAREGFRPTGLVGEGALELRPGSAFLAAFNSAAPTRVDANLLLLAGETEDWLSPTIDGPDDGFVAGSSALMDFPGHEVYSGESRSTVPCGHWELAVHAETRSAIREFLGRIEASCVPVLKWPYANALLDNGCPDWPDSVLWSFGWFSCPGADRYQIAIEGPPGSPPELNCAHADAPDTTYKQRVYGAVADEDLVAGWTWKVRAHSGDVWGPWSEARPFKLEPPTRDCPGCFWDLAVDGLFVTGTSRFYVGSIPWTRYALSVTMYDQIPYNGFFLPAPHFPPCPDGKTANRVRVDILDGHGAPLGSFCSLANRDALFDKIWFDLPTEQAPPDSVVVRLVDLFCDRSYSSAPASTDYRRCYPDMPNPVLSVSKLGETSTYVEYLLTITNLDQIPPDLFAPATDLAPCGLNRSSSRTWVDIRSDVPGIGYSYCGLRWDSFLYFTMSAPKSGAQPAYFYMIWTDRRCNRVYRTNYAPTGYSAPGRVHP